MAENGYNCLFSLVRTKTNAELTQSLLYRSDSLYVLWVSICQSLVVLWALVLYVNVNTH